MVRSSHLSHAGGVSDNDSPPPHPHEAVAKAAGCCVYSFVHPLHFNRAPDSMLGTGNQGIDEVKGQSCPPETCCPVVEKDDFPSHYFVTMVMVAGRRSIRSGALPGSVVDRLARPTDLPGLWPQHPCWARGTGCWGRCPASFLQTAGLDCSPKKQPLLPTPLLSGWKMKHRAFDSPAALQSSRFIGGGPRLTAGFFLWCLSMTSVLKPLPPRPPPPRLVSIT